MFPRASLLNKYLYFSWLQVLASQIYIQPFVQLSLLLNASAADFIFAVVEIILCLQAEIDQLDHATESSLLQHPFFLQTVV